MNHFSPMLPKDPYPQQLNNSELERSQVLRASWTDKQPSKASQSFSKTNNTFASSTFAKQYQPQSFAAKQGLHDAKGPRRSGLNHSKSQSFLRREPENRDEMGSRNSVVRMSTSNSQLKNSSSGFINPTKSVRHDQFEPFNP